MSALMYRAGELFSEIKRDRRDWVPEEFRTGNGLVYSSPATLAYNSPGAEGFGVKRAALSVPESVELIISPGCCGRNTSEISSMDGYQDRFYYLTMDEADIVSGRYLKRIPKALKRILSDRSRMSLPLPRVVMLVTTCVDALMGTDMDRIAGICERECGVAVRPAYMYALTREGVKPPMVQVGESIFSLLEKRDKDPLAVNILGSYGGLLPASLAELRDILSSAGLCRCRELSACADFDEFMKMSEASLNIQVYPDAVGEAEEMNRRFGTGYVELQRFYGIERITSQYRALLSYLGADDHILTTYRDRVVKDIEPIKEAVSIGECINGNPAELALSLMECGYKVAEVFTALSANDAYYIARIAEMDPDVKFYFNQHPSMVDFEPDKDAGLCLGRDASWYYRDSDVRCIDSSSEAEPFGYSGLERLIRQISGDVPVKKTTRVTSVTPRSEEPIQGEVLRGYRRALTPFAPDQSGAVEVLRQIEGMMVVVLDAGGCTGNICGFDIRDWEQNPSMIFSAGLRDMDAVFGRDEELIRKIKKAAGLLDPAYIALVGTPVPSVIGTDLNGLSIQVERACGIRTISVDTNGCDYYDKGMEKAYSRILADHIGEDGLLPGLSALDYTDSEIASIRKRNPKPAAFSVAGLEAAGGMVAASELMVSEEIQQKLSLAADKKRILIIGEQLYSNALRELIEKENSKARVMVADFFIMKKELKRQDDVRLGSEDDLIRLLSEYDPDLIAADPTLRELVPGYSGEWINRRHFALSGR
ncbi:MAG: nitrogenase component 1 [Lachnospiraceae bacterium]|nr:nitrogenase component 1 [Lachnospiraceae bacterium]